MYRGGSLYPPDLTSCYPPIYRAALGPNCVDVLVECLSQLFLIIVGHVILLRVSLCRLVNRLSSLGHYRSLRRAAAVAGGVATSYILSDIAQHYRVTNASAVHVMHAAPYWACH